MEIRENNQSPTTSPNSNGSSSNSNGSLQVPTPPRTPTPIPRSDTNPYPTTFVQADTSTFKQVVQMLTGSSETAQKASKSDPPPASSAAKGGARIPPIKSTGGKKQGFKLYERRNSLKNGLMINTLTPGLGQNSSFSPREAEILSPSILDFPSLVLSPVTPLNEDTPSKSSPSMGSASEEEKAIAEKKFYLHPSPRTSRPRDSQPQLLPLFPVTSPRVSGSSS
ncbi:VQ motif-containing protein 4-like [Olea europaea var. sylvestris]|uniref:VQ motif-containing protein 4-like n=1 Tax=Olea europaea var. sylvestris TaxID=158386 RepID=UPI000C1D051C|nr:VQ motif-containing protein 4-like [Olea europaea var. sylvestris]